MPQVQILAAPTPAQEPISLAVASAALRLDLDLTGTDPALVAQREYLQTLLSAAREKVEAYTGNYYAAQTLNLTYRLDEPYALPPGATATAVTGLIGSVADLPGLGAYAEEYRKGIVISRDLPWGAAAAQTYTVTAALDAAQLQVPALAKAAILELAGEWFRNRETTVAGVAAIAELPVSWKVKLAHLRGIVPQD